MFLQRWFLTRICNKTNHGFITFRIEIFLSIILIFNQFFKIHFTLAFGVVIFKLIFEVCYKSKIIFKNNFQSLIIKCLPFPRNSFFITVFFITIFTENSGNRVIWINFNLPNIFLLELPLITFWKNLYFVGQLMGTNFFRFK